MNAKDPLLFRQLQIVQKIIEDETWLEGERRGYAVSPNDWVVRENVCRVVLRIGKQMRENALAAMGSENGASGSTLHRTDGHEHLNRFQTAAA